MRLGLCIQRRRRPSCFHSLFEGVILLFKKCSKGGYFGMELCKVFGGPFDEFSKPHRIKMVGINVANNMTEPAQVIKNISHFSRNDSGTNAKHLNFHLPQ